MTNEVEKVEQTVEDITRLNKWLLALFIALIVFLVAESVLIVSALLRVDRSETIFDYPIQTVQNRVTGIEGPAVRIPDDGSPFDVTVVAEKCSDSDKNVTVETRVSWDTIDPRGTLIEDWNGIQEIAPGCETYTYVNQVPELVVSRTIQLIDSFPTLNCVKWSIVGVDSPLGPRLSPERWFTEPFCIYPPLNPVEGA